jgi:hypothetical protein
MKEVISVHSFDSFRVLRIIHHSWAIFPSLQRRDGRDIKKMLRTPPLSGRGGQFGETLRPKHFAELLLRLRPIGLALRATPSAPLAKRKRDSAQPL